MKFNWVDAVIILTVARGVYVGYKGGLSQEFFRFLALVSAYYSALMFHSRTARFIVEHSLIKEKWALIISFVGIASLAFVLVIIFFKLLQKWVRLEFENKLNVYGGAVAGGLRGAIIVSLILFAVFFIPDQFVKRQIYKNSFLGYYAIEITPKVYAWVSKKISNKDESGHRVRSRFDREKNKLNEEKKEEAKEGLSTEPAGGGIDDVQEEIPVQGPEEIEPIEIKDEELVNRPKR